MTDRQNAIVAVLEQHEEPITFERVFNDLPANFRVTEREFRREVDRMKLAGVRILSSTRHGYWLARTVKDIPACREAARTRRAHAIAEIRDANQFDRWAVELEQEARQCKIPLQERAMDA